MIRIDVDVHGNIVVNNKTYKFPGSYLFTNEYELKMFKTYLSINNIVFKEIKIQRALHIPKVKKIEKVISKTPMRPSTLKRLKNNGV
jgi:hypothetical protein